MILQSLVSYYEQLAQSGEISLPGWSMAKVDYALNISPEGQLLYATPLSLPDAKGKMRPQSMQVPLQQKRAVNIAANFMCDNASYFLGVDNKGKPDRTQKCFETAAALHQEILGKSENPVARAICAYFDNWIPGQAEKYAAIADEIEALKQASGIVFFLEDQKALDDLSIRKCWQEYYEQPKQVEKGICSVTGKKASIARLHPSIKGIQGAQSSGASLVSFNADAYNSYDKEQGDNAAVGEYAAFAYGTALNHLLADREHVTRLGDTTMVYWAQGKQSGAVDAFADMLNPAESETEQRELKAAMERLAQGETAAWKGKNISPDTPFYILGLAPNAARLSIRFFQRNSFGVFARRMLEHQQRLDIVKPAFDQREQLSFWALFKETINPNSRDQTASPVMVGETIRAVLGGTKYPSSLLNGVMLRIRAEKEITRGRAAIIKAYYLMSPHPDIPKEVLQVACNQESKNIPYNLGRLFSILVAIQEQASPKLNTTIKDKYFNSAAATPATIFPLLISMAQNHLKKLDIGMKINYEKQMGSILEKWDHETFPTRLSLPEQGAFQLGYYHQQQKRFQTKEEK